MRELRADFRRSFHVGYDDVSVSEALSLASTLRDGSEYLAALDIHRAWTHEEQMLADINDTIERFLRMKSSAGTTEGARTVPRPWDAADQAAELDRAKRVRDRIEDTEWEEVRLG